MKRPICKPGLVCTICLAILISGILGYMIGKATVKAPVSSAVADILSESGPALKLSVVEDPQAEYATLLEENTESSFTKVSIRSGIAQANIELDGEILSLADALESGRITQEKIAYLARLDARNGYCEQTHATRNGLTHFTYQYPTFNLRIVYDVYVTPDGGEDLINHVSIYPVRDNEILGPYVDFYDPVTGERTDLEDWGLTFSLVAISPTGATIECQQTGGQQIGQLSVDWYFLSNESGFVPHLDASVYSPTCDVTLNRNGETSFTLDWTDVYGQLPGGTYQLTLNVIDHFDEADVHPLMQDYHDWQQYTIDFTVS